MPEGLEQKLIDLLLQYNAFKIEDTVLASGRESPYMIDFGKISDGFGLTALGEIFASKIKELESRGVFAECNVIFGVSYKGLVIGEVCINSLAKDGVNRRFSYDRKEQKDHGEQGWFVGDIKDEDTVLIIDDVFTTGDSKLNVIKQLNECYKNLRPGILVGVNRQEYAEEKYFYEVDSIKSITDTTSIFKYLAETGKIDAAAIGKFKNYMRQYGTEEAKRACEAIWPLSLSKVIKN